MGRTLIDVKDARALVLERAGRLEDEDVALADCPGRVLAVDVVSPGAVPPFDSSAMDGFAVRFADLRGARETAPVRLALAGESRAGQPSRRPAEPGGAIAISTGAVLPEGADSVVPLEQARSEDGHVEICRETAPGANVRRAGEDIAAGQGVLAAGTIIGPAEVGVLASLGCAEGRCSRRPRVAVISTGDELVAPGTPLGEGQIYDSNAHSIPALARQAGAEVLAVTSAPDEAAATRAAIAEALAGSDVAVLCGGVSVGPHDHVKDALRELGVEESFWGVALKPGKPTWFGSRGRVLVFGLPGNPVSAMVTFVLFAAPALRAMSGCASPRREARGVLVRDYAKSAERAHALRCRLRVGERGLEADSPGDTGSHVLSSMLGADALAIIPREAELVRAGEQVELELMGEWR